MTSVIREKQQIYKYSPFVFQTELCSLSKFIVYFYLNHGRTGHKKAPLASISDMSYVPFSSPSKFLKLLCKHSENLGSG